MSIDLNTLTPDQVATLPAAERKRVILRCSALIQGAASADEEAAANGDRLLTAAQVGEVLGLKASGVRSRNFPFKSEDVPGRWHERGMREWMAGDLTRARRRKHETL